MTSPFDTQSRAATLLDRLSLRLLLLFGCVAYFAVLWRAPRESLLAGGALCQVGTPEEVFTGGELDRVFGVTVRRVRTENGWLYYCQET